MCPKNAGVVLEGGGPIPSWDPKYFKFKYIKRVLFVRAGWSVLLLAPLLARWLVAA